MLPPIQIDNGSDISLYRQVHGQIADAITSGLLPHGQKLPATRELAGQLGLNRTTVSAAYALLEADGLIQGHVGRGSFVHHPEMVQQPFEQPEMISFASSRPAEEEFPIADFQSACHEAVGAANASTILQLGSPLGFGPLRSFLMEEARQEGCAGPDDDILITSGCQQALDLLQRVFAPAGTPVAIEDPVYHGIKNIFARTGVELTGVPMSSAGIEMEELARTLARSRPKLLVLTPNFQNPTGTTMPAEARIEVLRLAQDFGVTIIENDIYGALRYSGANLPTLRQIDGARGTILLRSFSKVAFPGLRVGWIIAPKPIIAELVETRRWCDLHTDQLSQAILLRFVASGRLDSHLHRVRRTGAARVSAAVAACARNLPAGSDFTTPEGGMSLWVRLPSPLDSAELLPRAEREHVTYLPGKHFAVSHYDPGTLRLCFGSLTPERITKGIAALGRIFTEELERTRRFKQMESASALV